MTAPERIWLLWPDGMIPNRFAASAADHTEEGYPAFIRADLHADALDRLAAAEAERDQWIEHAKAAIWTDSEECKVLSADLAAAEAKLHGNGWCFDCEQATVIGDNLRGSCGHGRVVRVPDRLAAAEALIGELVEALDFYAPKVEAGIRFAAGDDDGKRASAALAIARARKHMEASNG